MNISRFPAAKWKGSERAVAMSATRVLAWRTFIDEGSLASAQLHVRDSRSWTTMQGSMEDSYWGNVNVYSWGQ